MSRFVLVVVPSGGMVLTTEQPLSQEAAHHAKLAFEEWRNTPEGLVIIAECRVQAAASVEIDLPVPA